jgi:hypothetical protein
MMYRGEYYLRYDRHDPDHALLCNDLYGYRWKMPLLKAIGHAGRLNRAAGLIRTMDGEQMSQRDIGKRINRNQRTISKIITKFLRRMRERAGRV